MIPWALSLRFELLWFLQLLGFCGSFLWLVGQDCGRDCSGHGKHLGQGGREGGMQTLLLSLLRKSPILPPSLSISANVILTFNIRQH